MKGNYGTAETFEEAKAEVRSLMSDLSLAKEQRDASRDRVDRLEKEKAALEKEWSERLERYRKNLTDALSKAYNERDNLRDELAKIRLAQRIQIS